MLPPYREPIPRSEKVLMCIAVNQTNAVWTLIFYCAINKLRCHNRFFGKECLFFIVQ